MAYKAYVNDNLFFDTSLNDVSFLLSAARLDLQAGSSGSFTFVIPPSNPYYGTFDKLVDYVDVYRDSQLIFSGRVYSIRQRLDTQYEIECEGLLSVLVDSIFRPYTYDGTLHNLVQAIITSHNSQVESRKQITIQRLGIADTDVYRDYQNYETSISRLKDLFDSFGGYPYITKTSNGLKFYWLDHMEEGCDQKVELKSNLLDINVEDTSDGICTVLIPIGGQDENGLPITIASVNDGKDYLTAGSAYIDTYGYVTKVQEWPDVNTPSILKTKGQAFLEASLLSRITINVSALDLADAGYSVESFYVGEVITVSSPPHGIQNVAFDCQSQTLDLLNPANNQLSLGAVQTGYVKNNRSNDYESLLNKISEAAVTRTAMMAAIENATALITGQEGGYIVYQDTDGDDEPDEILIMDTPDITTARKIWRWNNSGFGYSSTGYNGPYGTAITMDGGIVGSFLTALSVTAEKIAAGAITAAKIDAGAVTANKIASGAVTADKIDAGAVTVAKIGSGAVSAEKIASGAVTAVKIEDGAVTANKINSGAVTTSKLDAAAVTAEKIGSGAITTDKLAANAVTAAKINVTDLFSQSINATNFTISGGKVHVNSNSDSEQVIRLASGGYVGWYAPIQIWFGFTQNNSTLYEISYMADGIHGITRNGSVNHTYGFGVIYTASGTQEVGQSLIDCNHIWYTELHAWSDRRLKTNIETIDRDRAVEFVLNLRPVVYEQIDALGNRHHGFIAQEIEEINPDSRWKLVSTMPATEGSEPNDLLSLNYVELIPDLVATIQSLNQRISDLERRIDVLCNRNTNE